MRCAIVLQWSATTNSSGTVGTAVEASTTCRPSQGQRRACQGGTKNHQKSECAKKETYAEGVRRLDLRGQDGPLCARSLDNRPVGHDRGAFAGSLGEPDESRKRVSASASAPSRPSQRSFPASRTRAVFQKSLNAPSKVVSTLRPTSCANACELAVATSPLITGKRKTRRRPRIPAVQRVVGDSATRGKKAYVL